MTLNKIFSDIGWEGYQYWIQEDKKILKKINALIQDIERNGNEGLGKPEALKKNLSGYWSRRITDVHRIVYRTDDNNLFIAKCRGHYNRPLLKSHLHVFAR